MILKGQLFFLAIFFVLLQGIAQPALYIPRNIQDAFDKNTRSLTGKPGINYWQNAANYTVDVNFHPGTRELSGTVNIEYINNSPDTLKKILFKLYPNLYKKGSPRSVQDFDATDETNGVDIKSITVNGAENKTYKPVINGTNMIVSIEPLIPKKTVLFTINYSYTLNKGSHVRTGEIEPGAAFIAYFFPRIAVYDDIDGWNKNPYTGLQEFYNDFCQFKVNITVPKDYIVWATGGLLNCGQVFTEPYCQRIQQAEKSDEIITVIDSFDLQKGNITANNPTNTWQFKADNVTDFAFAVSNHYIWKSSSLIVDTATGRRTRVDAVFNPTHADYFEVINYARSTVDIMSHTFPAWPFPYPHETVFDGLDQMEYPMMVNDNPLDDRDAAIELTVHEIFHTMFPFYMGTNETKYEWMDEGWATIGEWLISPMIDADIVDDYGAALYQNIAGKEEDQPITTLSTEQADGDGFFLNSYPKPAFGYLFVKNMLGDELFKKALHYYIAQWQGKHPMPYDFFNCINTASGKNLNWFWKRWFFDNGFPDLAIAKVENKKGNYTILINAIGSKPVPVHLTVYFKDGTQQKIHRSIQVWENNNTNLTLTFKTGKPVQKIMLGSPLVPDVNKADNVYEIQ